jgi:hypothetical protein
MGLSADPVNARVRLMHQMKINHLSFPRQRKSKDRIETYCTNRSLLCSPNWNTIMSSRL